MLISRPVQSWRRSASICGGWRSLISSCALGKHRWCSVYDINSKAEIQCFICRKTKEEPDDVQ